jgi:L-alanine-DL-glutamate epimerase-like enolase superfamily enzyme
MRIVKAETSIIEIPFALKGTGVGIMPTAWKSLEFALVRLEDELGNVGWGEGFGYFTVDATKAIVDRLILPALVGTTVDTVAEWNLRTQRQIHMFGRFGITIFAISGVDIALWDLAAKRAGLPLCRLLSGAQVRDSVPFYASLVRYADERLVSEACAAALDAGFNDIKLHETRLPEIEAGRSALGPERKMCVDVNCGWSSEFVRENAEHLARLNLWWLEEPVFPPEDFEALRRLRRSPSPIAAGENYATARQCLAALDAEAVDILQPSITKVGGVSEYLKVIDAAAERGVTMMPHSPYFGPGLFASLHVAAARPSVGALEWNFVQPEAWLADIESRRSGSQVAVPQVPGIGFEPDPDVLRRYRRA